MAEKVTIGNCELWHGDCREVLPLLPPVDLVLTDPPYGIGADTHAGKAENGWTQYGPGGWDKERPAPWLFGLMQEKAKECVIWGGNARKGNEMKLNAEWTDDCCGKRDYDGEVLSVSTRYWPRGGSALMLDTARPELGLHHVDDGSKPSAHSSLLLYGDGDYVTLTDKEFEAETFEEVAAQVEAWAQEQMDKAEAALRAAFERPNGEVRGASVTAQPACEASSAEGATSTVVLEGRTTEKGN